MRSCRKSRACSSAAAPLWAGFLALANQQATASAQPAIGYLKPLQRIQELDADVSHLIRPRRELLAVLDGESDAVDGNARLIRQFEFHWRRPGR